MEPFKLLPLWVRMTQGVMTINGFSIYPRDPELAPQIRRNLVPYPKRRWAGLSFFRGLTMWTGVVEYTDCISAVS